MDGCVSFTDAIVVTFSVPIDAFRPTCAEVLLTSCAIWVWFIVSDNIFRVASSEPSSSNWLISAPGPAVGSSESGEAGSGRIGCGACCWGCCDKVT